LPKVAFPPAVETEQKANLVVVRPGGRMPVFELAAEIDQFNVIA
jgi:hypothetical protein